MSSFLNNNEKLGASLIGGGILSALLTLGAAPVTAPSNSVPDPYSMKTSTASTAPVDQDSNGVATPAPVGKAQGNTTIAPHGTPDWSALVGRVAPSVVSVRVQGVSGGGVGSGVVMDKEGYIITNNHVVSQTGQSLISVVFADSSVFDAQVVKADEKSDLAVIKLTNPPTGLTPIRFSPQNPTVGSPVLAVGSPLGLSGTVTNGIISAVNRPVTSQDTKGQAGALVINALQTNAAINPGNSGGALVNAQGELVGINSSIATTGQSNGNIGIGFAIPSTTVAKVSSYLRKGQDFPYGKLGVQVQDGVGRENKRGVLGARVREVVRGSGASEADIREGDVIVAVNGEPVASSSALVGQVRTFEKDFEVVLKVVRNGGSRDHKVKLG